MRAKRLWQQRQTTMSESSGTRTHNGPITHSVSAITKNGQRRTFTNARKGRGCRTADWVRELQTDLIDEFDRLRRMGMKFSANTLKLPVKDMILSSTRAAYHRQMRYGKDEELLANLVTQPWNQRVMANNNIVLRHHTGKLQLLPEAQQKIARRVAFFLSKVAREF